MSTEAFIAVRYLRSKRKEAFISLITIISILGVAISVMVLNIVLSVMTGFEGELRNKLVGASAHITIRRLGGDIQDWEEVKDKILKFPGVVNAYPYTYNQAMLSVEGGARGVLVRGVSADPNDRKRLSDYFDDPSVVELLDKPGSISVVRPDGTTDSVELQPLIVGRELQRRLGLSIGEPVTLFSPQLRSSPQGLIPRQRRFVVMGTYSSGLVEYEAGMAYAPMDATQSFFGLERAVSGVEILLEDLYQAKPIAKQIVDALTADGPVYYATDWMEPNRPLWEALELEKRVYFIVLLLLVLIASFSIVSTLVMVVMEKGRDIAILKSLGASDKFVLKIFLLKGALIGFSGTVLGTLLGYLGSIGLREYGFEIDAKVFSLDTVPVYILSENFLTVFVAGFFISSLAGIYPARRAARLQPAVALRYE